MTPEEVAATMAALERGEAIPMIDLSNPEELERLARGFISTLGFVDGIPNSEEEISEDEGE